MQFQPGTPKPTSSGRKKGVTNKRTALLKDAILAAAEKAGKGDIVAYLERQAEENPVFRVVAIVLELQRQDATEQGKEGVITQVVHVVVDTREQADMIHVPAMPIEDVA